MMVHITTKYAMNIRSEGTRFLNRAPLLRAVVSSVHTFCFIFLSTWLGFVCVCLFAYAFRVERA